MSEAIVQSVTATPITVTRTGHQSLAFADLAEGRKVADMIKAAGMYQHFKTQEQIIAAITRGYELGMTPHQALASIIQIEGKYSLTAESMRALVLANLKPGEFFIVNASDEAATAKALRQGWPEPQVYELTHAQLAKTNTGSNPNFRNRPRVMLSARVTSEACRMWFADITGGFYTPDEIREMAPVETATPTLTPHQSAKAAFAKKPEALVMEAEFTEAEPEPVEHWTEETVGEWEGAFARCSTLEAVNAAVEGLKVEKKAHPAISSTMNKRLGDAYNKAKARVEATE